MSRQRLVDGVKVITAVADLAKSQGEYVLKNFGTNPAVWRTSRNTKEHINRIKAPVDAGFALWKRLNEAPNEQPNTASVSVQVNEKSWSDNSHQFPESGVTDQVKEQLTSFGTNQRQSISENYDKAEIRLDKGKSEITEQTNNFALSFATDKCERGLVNEGSKNAVKQKDGEREVHKMQISRVPSSRISRLWHYGGLAASIALGSAGEKLRRLTGLSTNSSLVLTEKNVWRIVSKLSRMRGAALKLGQMISFQDSDLVPEQVRHIFQKLQNKADYMPVWQRESVLVKNLGKDWRDLFEKFDEEPMAAASIGQVHHGVLKLEKGLHVATKIQFPGVEKSIDSDLSNLSILLTTSKLLPRGLFLEKTIENARLELGWECDYEREAKNAIRFKRLLADDDVFQVPRVIKQASGRQVLTLEFLGGRAINELTDELTQQERDWVGYHIIRLCLREIFEFGFMQSDPNWTNFLFVKSSNMDSNRQSETKVEQLTGAKIQLIDFGACREYETGFLDTYISVLKAAAQHDRNGIVYFSRQLGYLTGLESENMVNAHVESVLTLAEPFNLTAPAIYDFNTQKVTQKVNQHISVMLRERLTAPPEETYSLHRKLSGAFLLCTRLKSRVNCRKLFQNAVARREFTQQL